jgi:hypothetical protein
MFLIAVIAAAGMGSAPAPMVPMHISSPSTVSAPPVSRPVNPAPVARPALRPPERIMKPEERKPGVARLEPHHAMPPSQCIVSQNQGGMLALYGIAVAPPSPALACGNVDIPMPRVPVY